MFHLYCHVNHISWSHKLVFCSISVGLLPYQEVGNSMGDSDSILCSVSISTTSTVCSQLVTVVLLLVVVVVAVLVVVLSVL